MPSNRTIRTFCLTGADGSGKTALVEAFLRLADAKRANPEGSTSRLDAEPEEKKRNFTLSIHPETFEEGGRTFNALDTPGFAAKMAEIEGQRTSIRDEIGDQRYDRYLAALDQPNRVAVNEVLLESPAAAAGLQAGDVVLSYGETRIFAPSELVTATRAGTAGENVRMEILRQGRRFEIQLPRGPLGVSVAASRGDPGEG